MLLKDGTYSMAVVNLLFPQRWRLSFNHLWKWTVDVAAEISVVWLCIMEIWGFSVNEIRAFMKFMKVCLIFYFIGLIVMFV